jgi:hypothetical protein
VAKVRTHRPVKLIVGLLSGDEDLLRRARQRLFRRFGEVDLESDIWDFTETDYYEAEMGPDLRRWFISFDRLVRPDDLPQIKLETNRMEEEIAEDCVLGEVARPVNIDPGYIDLPKLVLATTKNHAHRLYLGSGIYGEVTLHMAEGQWRPATWTYPDYRRSEYHAFFTRVRDRLQEQYKTTQEG